MSIVISLPKFEGPLALLLYLIRKEEMDIMDIKIHEITSQYLEYIKLMKELDLEFAGDFIAMAATLLQIKSRMLLPQYDENGEIIENDDPRKELVQKLLEYQKYQEAGKALYERPLVGRDIWLRGFRERLEPQEEGIEIEDNGLFSLITAYRKIAKAAIKRIHRVTAKGQSIANRILEIKDRLIVGRRIALTELINSTEEKARQILITFLSTLELGKMGFVNLYQTEPFGEIWVEATRTIEADVITRVEEYDNVNSEDVAAKMMAKSEKANEAPLILEENIEETFMHDEEVAASEDELISSSDRLTEIASDDEINAAEEELFHSIEDVNDGEKEV